MPGTDEENLMLIPNDIEMKFKKELRETALYGPLGALGVATLTVLNSLMGGAVLNASGNLKEGFDVSQVAKEAALGGAVVTVPLIGIYLLGILMYHSKTDEEIDTKIVVPLMTFLYLAIMASPGAGALILGQSNQAVGEVIASSLVGYALGFGLVVLLSTGTYIHNSVVHRDGLLKSLKEDLENIFKSLNELSKAISKPLRISYAPIPADGRVNPDLSIH